jgi:hypothetical protein
MSHFCVLVLGNDVDELLAPYDENITVAPRVTGEVPKEDKDSFVEVYKVYNPKRTYGCTSKLQEEENKNLSFDELYSKYGKSWNSNSWVKQNDVWVEISTYNPNSKWDWYQIGGRYAGILLLKEGIEKKENPNFSWGWDEKDKEDVLNKSYVDSALISEIDWGKLHLNQEEYNKAINFWEMKVEGKEPITEEDKEELKYDYYKTEYYVDKYKTKETYAKAMSSFTTWAILDRSGWKEKGGMGWFGMSSESNDEGLEWELNMYDKFIKDLPLDTRLTIVDCHI